MRISRFILFVVVVLSFVIAGYFFGGIATHNGSVISSSGAIIMGCLSSLFIVFCPRKSVIDDPGRPVGIWKRLFAFYIDFYVALVFVLSHGIIPILVIEYVATSTWQWSYEREAFLARDVFSVAHILIAFWFIFYFFYKHAALQKATPGQYILGYRIIPVKTGRPRYSDRVLHGLIALWLSIFTLIITRDVKDGIYPWDAKSNTRAVATR